MIWERGERVGGHSCEWVSKLWFDAMVKFLFLACHFAHWWSELVWDLLVHLQSLQLVAVSSRGTWTECGSGALQSRELNSLEPVILHTLVRWSQENPGVQQAGGEETCSSRQKKLWLVCVWASFPLCFLIKHVLLTKVIQQFVETVVSAVSLYNTRASLADGLQL